MFPREDCILLPVENTTAELLARTLGRGLLDDLQRLIVCRVELGHSPQKFDLEFWREPANQLGCLGGLQWIYATGIG